jgi:imidazolonepropionase-like amidohydrolase
VTRASLERQNGRGQASACPLFLWPLLFVSTSAFAQAPSPLPGTYVTGPFSITFEASTYQISRGGQVAVSGEFQLARDTVTFRDRSGAIACNPAVAGRYIWKRDGVALTFTLVSDDCPGRKNGLPGRTWARKHFDGLALTGVTLIDGTATPPRPGMTILIASARITDVFPDGSKPIPAEIEIRNLPGRFVIPGLIDTHVHLATDPSHDDARSRVEPRLRRTLLGGVTSVRDMAGDARSLADLSRATKVGDLVGPSIYYSALFAGPDFFTDERVVATSRGEPIGQAPWARSVTAATDWRQVIAEARGTGASGIKLYAAISPDLLEPLVAEAHRQRLPVWAHAALIPARPSDVVNAGVDVVSHATLLALATDTATNRRYTDRYRVDYNTVKVSDPAIERLITEMLARRTILEPTLYVFFNRDSMAPAARWAGAITRQLHQRGVPIAAGTDGIIGVEGDTLPSGVTLPNLHHELRLLVAHGGLTPQEAIIAATATAARAIGIDSLVGTVSVGKQADLVVLSRDPLADISNTRRIELVVRLGKVVTN